MFYDKSEFTVNNFGWCLVRLQNSFFLLIIYSCNRMKLKAGSTECMGCPDLCFIDRFWKVLPWCRWNAIVICSTKLSSNQPNWNNHFFLSSFRTSSPQRDLSSKSIVPSCCTCTSLFKMIFSSFEQPFCFSSSGGWTMPMPSCTWKSIILPRKTARSMNLERFWKTFFPVLCIHILSYGCWSFLVPQF